MGLCLVEWLELLIVIVEVAIALGMVIFVHELGHFLVAKLCGVQCDKFYLGFDIAGLRLCRWKWGETEYGIGVLPLGGYVKMLGQEDNPARLREEIQRAKAQQASTVKTDARRGEAATVSGQAASTTQGGPVDIATVEQALYSPRSYLAKSVPKRMAIISAGVIMNVLFAALTAMTAYWMGVPQMECGVGELIPGEAGWQAGLRVGDKITAVNGEPVARFQDLQARISLGDNLAKGVPLRIQRPGVREQFTVRVLPDQTGLIPRIGVLSPCTTSLVQKDTLLFSDIPKLDFACPGSVADVARPGFQFGDRVVRINDVPISDSAQIHEQLAVHPDKPLRFLVRRAVPDRVESAEEVAIEVAPQPMRRLGLVMEMGPVTAIQAGSPAAKAEIKPGDRILTIDGLPVGDPVTLPDRLRRGAQSVVLGIQREGQGKPLEVSVTLRKPDSYTVPVLPNNPLTADALGVAYRVFHRVESVIPGSPAAKAGIKPGDRVVKATIRPPDKEAMEKLRKDLGKPRLKQDVFSFDLDEKHPDWAAVIWTIQRMLPGTTVELRLASGRDVTLEPYVPEEWFNPDRGLIFAPAESIQKAKTATEAFVWGAEETVNSVAQVITFLRKIGTQVSPRALGGPVAIAQVAGQSASRGVAHLLLFLTLLSANLAVLNFLPIPVLDGGHIVFLLYEGIRGKPADERVQITLSYLGLLFILVLMLWLVGLDFGWIPRD